MATLFVQITNVTWFCRQLIPNAEVLETEPCSGDDPCFPLITNSQEIPVPGTSIGRTGGGCFGLGPGMWCQLHLND